MTRRISDSSAEREVAKFLDYHLYARLARAPFHFQSRRTDTLQDQRAGSDIILTAPHQTYTIDEKTQIYYINRSLPTFAFELDSIQNGVLRTGWFLDDTLATTHYLLVWPHALHTNSATLRFDDISKLECLCVGKTALKQFVTARGWDAQKLQQFAKNLREKKDYGPTKIGDNVLYFYFSNPEHYAEAPVNILFYRHVLEAIAEFSVTVFPTHLVIH